MKHVIFITATLLALAGCTSSPIKPLDQKLADAGTLAERKETLRLACLNEAEYTTDLKKAAYQRKYGSKRLEFVKDTEETARLKSLCREMTEENPDDKKAALAHECRKEIELGMKKNPENRSHFDKMLQICQKMTSTNTSLTH